MPIINEAQQPSVATAASSAATTLTLDTTTGGVQIVTLSLSTTFTFTAGTTVMAGDRFILKMIQDGTGSRVATWPSNFKKVGGSLTLSTAAAAVDLIEIVYDGTNFLEVGRNLALS